MWKSQLLRYSFMYLSHFLHHFASINASNTSQSLLYDSLNCALTPRKAQTLFIRFCAYDRTPAPSQKRLLVCRELTSVRAYLWCQVPRALTLFNISFTSTQFHMKKLMKLFQQTSPDSLFKHTHSKSWFISRSSVYRRAALTFLPPRPDAASPSPFRRIDLPFPHPYQHNHPSLRHPHICSMHPQSCRMLLRRSDTRLWNYSGKWWLKSGMQNAYTGAGHICCHLDW